MDHLANRTTAGPQRPTGATPGATAKHGVRKGGGRHKGALIGPQTRSGLAKLADTPLFGASSCGAEASAV